nr:MAG TPA: hypothetical protein [Caudoviricetes sp.]
MINVTSTWCMKRVNLSTHPSSLFAKSATWSSNLAFICLHLHFRIKP